LASLFQVLKRARNIPTVYARGRGQCFASEQTEEEMSVRAGINGFGRTGRAAFRAAVERGADIEWVGINDVMDKRMAVHLLKHDSTFGPFPARIEVTDAGMSVDGTEVPFSNATDPGEILWASLGAEVVIESSGRFRDRDAAARHLDAGATKVVISAPSKDPDVTVAVGINFREAYDPARHDVISNASCTTNCLATVAKVLHESVGIRHGMMTTVHAYTADQRLQDLPHKDLRRARAAAINIIPTTTGAASALGLVIPELAGRLHGYALRVPIATGSVVDLTIESERPTSAQEINEIFRERARSDALEGVLEYSEEPLVSTDIIQSPRSAIFDAGLTSVIDGTSVKAVAWYDNEWGYSNRLVDIAERVLATVPQKA
jgi:glyceraldehyde 3-phosphate dehydrogenase